MAHTGIKFMTLLLFHCHPWHHSSIPCELSYHISVTAIVLRHTDFQFVLFIPHAVCFGIKIFQRGNKASRFVRWGTRGSTTVIPTLEVLGILILVGRQTRNFVASLAVLAHFQLDTMVWTLSLQTPAP